ncbi:unnamed protein product [Calicophoron daubneyi]|uniref:Zinc-hook domain-containing protein n=1 Tax=Calicophoron daubneyi TaxID=300641 RepID=A0AAV2TXX6_CALDB
MALVERMSILGIRSFSHENPQKIEFFTPVTLILGPNGTGKTTIIECLKYATTGDLPPGSKTGCSFIHDPRVAREVEVKAKVTLQLRDVRGQPMVVSRALVATQREKAKQGTLKTLDGSIKRQLPDGRVTSISSKCAEIDHEMVTSLGVSKAVLENVIFCHQEDSNWPLQEAKSVKQRFDDLFASSRYVKALDAMRKCKQDKDSNIKLYKAEIKHLSKNRDEAMKVRDEMENMKASVEKQNARLQDVTNRLNPVVERLNLYKQKYAELIQLQAQIKSCEAEKSHIEETVSSLLLNIHNEFEGTNEELAHVVDDAEAEYAKKQHRLTQLESQIQTNQSKLRGCESKRTQLLVEQAQLEMEVKRLQEAVGARDNLMRTLAERHNLSISTQLPGRGINLSTIQVDSVIQQMKEALRDADNQLSQVKRTTESAEREAQTKLDSARDELARLKQKFDATQQSLRETTTNLNTLRLRSAKAQETTARLESVRSELTRAEEHDRQLREKTELSETRERLSGLLDEQRSAESSLEVIDERITAYQKYAEQRRELDSLQKDRANKLETARKIRSRHIDTLEQIYAGSSVPSVVSDEFIKSELSKQQGGRVGTSLQSFATNTERLRNSFLARLSAMEQATREARRNLAKAEQERSVLETKTKYSRTRLQEKQNKLRSMEEQILSVAGTPDLEQSLNKLQQRRKQLEEECANEQGSLYLWKKFRDRLARPDTDCPVCHRHLSDQGEQGELVAELDQRIAAMPGEFVRKKQELEELVKKHEILLQLRPTVLEIERLKNTELPALDLELKTELEKLEEVRNRSDEESARLENCQADEALARSVQGDVAVFERIENEVFDISCKLRRLESDGTTSLDQSESFESLQEQRKEIRQKQQSLAEEISRTQKLVEQLDRTQREAVDEVHRIKEVIYKLEQENQANLRLADDIQRATESEQRLQTELSLIKFEQMPPAEERCAQAAAERQRAAQDRESRVDSASESVKEIRDAIRQIDSACQAASARSPESRLTDVNSQVSKLEEEVAHLRLQLDDIRKDLEIAQKELNEHKIRQRELGDCVQLRQLRSQVGELGVRIQGLTDQLTACRAVAGADQDLVKETGRMSAEEERLRNEKNAVTNQLGQLTAKLQYLQRDLKEKYAGADEEYLDMMYQLRTTELACSDLERYYKALDRAILAYHAAKMADLNKIIRELWRTTYRGNDIDYIEICSEEENASSAETVMRARRTYNYRVVMVKTVGVGMGPTTGGGTRNPKSRSQSNEARLDMRGRCSAGQKVLASLIIRLALAEVFCLHCGVLALDEPTTNLDRENIESLAFALVEIIKNRRQQKNFQLIVITHDEDFVELLGRSDFVEDFFLLSRNMQGVSEMKKVPIDGHFH